MDVVTGLVEVLIFAAVAVALFTMGRSLILWYWRVNRIVELLESIDQRLREAAEPPPYRAPAPVEREASVSPHS